MKRIRHVMTSKLLNDLPFGAPTSGAPLRLWMNSTLTETGRFGQALSRPGSVLESDFPHRTIHIILLLTAAKTVRAANPR
jgi:hypothetical protein